MSYTNIINQFIMKYSGKDDKYICDVII